ncbi:MAG: penicillin acylase family protein [Pseudomonadales bacterium]
MFKKIVLAIVVLAAISITVFIKQFNQYQSEGELTLAILDQPATVSRDVLGIPYIYAGSLADGLRTQGFIVAQDRLYQMELYRHIGQGRLAELIGERGVQMDILMRTVGIQQVADQQILMLSDDARDYYIHYIEGVNAYIEQQVDEYPFSLKMLGHSPTPWTLHDIVSLQFFQIWGSTANWRVELLAQQLLDTLGSELANEISMVTINPDDESINEARLTDEVALGLEIDPKLYAVLPQPMNAASNAWASDGKKSKNGMPIFSNSPHIDARIMPGFWYPMAIITPELRAVGAAAPGTPGFGIARTDNIIFGATNGNSDGADLYIETLDPSQPDHYLEGDTSLALTIREETLRIKDADAEGGYRQQNLRIRSTRRGPLISDHGMALDDSRAISLRWATVGSLADSLGGNELLVAKNLDQARAALLKNPTPLSHIIVDRHGDVARISTGHVPIRIKGDGSKPFVITDSEDNWAGIIPASEMPANIRPDRGWVGTANHRVVAKDYAYENYSSFFAASWRYRRITEYMTDNDIMSSDNHWQLINDLKNPMAEQLAPIMIEALANNEETEVLATLLENWDYFDTRESAGAAVFQVMTKHYLSEIFEDEIAGDLFKEFQDSIYYWQERLLLLSQNNNNHWFDNKNTAATETRDDVLVLSGKRALLELNQSMGDDPADWQWGKIMTITFASPLIPGDTAAKWLGGGVHPMFGSGETLNRGGYKPSKGYEASFIDSIRFVSDMADPDKIIAVIPGGSSGRYLDDALHNQTEAWLAGERHHLWFSDKAIRQNTVKTLSLTPAH